MRYLLLTVLLLSLACSAMASVVFDTIPNPDPSGMASFGYQACKISELGDHISFTGAGKLASVRVGMVSWATANGDFTTGQAYTDPNIITSAAGWYQPITLNIYSVQYIGGIPVVGDWIASKTATFHIPWAVGSVHPYKAVCFDFSNDNITLPGEVIYGVAFNTYSYGVNPTGFIGPYCSLNVGAYSGAILAGTDVNPTRGFVSSTWNGMYGTGIPGVFSFSDGGGDFSGGYKASVEFNTVDTYSVTPKMLTSGNPRFGVDSSIGVGPGAADDAPAGFGTSSFCATVDKNSTVESTRYRSIRLNPEAIFGHPVMLSQIASMSYFTKNIDATLDWRYTIYTKKTGTNDRASWYHSRFESNAVPTDVKNIWQNWSTDQLLFVANRFESVVYNKTWSEVTSADATDECYFFDLILGANTGGGIGTSQLDAVTIKLTSGEVAVLDLTKDATLSLEPNAASIYVMPGESILVDMNIADLPYKVNACQAMLGYSSTYFADPTSSCVTAGGDIWDQVIWDSWKDSTGIAGEIDTAIGVNVNGMVGTDQPGTVAKITLTSKTDAPDGITKMYFRPDVAGNDSKQTFISDMNAQAVWPAKVDSLDIYVDSTAPVITCAGNYVTNAAQADITASASDALAGIDTFTMNGNTFTSPTTVTLVPGNNTFDFVATDKAGNVSNKTLTIAYTQPAPSINVYRSLAPNKYGSSNWSAWLGNAVAGAVAGGQAQGSGNAAFADFGNATQDFTSVMVTSSNSWNGIAGGTELGTATHFVWRLDNGIQSNAGAAKLDVRNIAIDFKEITLGTDSTSDDLTTDYSSWWNGSASSASFGGTSALKGFNWDGSNWVEVTTGTKADLVVYGWFRYAVAPEYNPSPVTQSVTNKLYKQLAGSVPFLRDTDDPGLGMEPRRTLDSVALEVKYQQLNVVDGTSGVLVTKFASTETSKPVIAINSPIDGLKTNVASQTIAGLVSDNNTLDSGVREIKVSLNDSLVNTYNSIDPVNFSDVVTLTEGNNTIKVEAKDFKGNTESKTINVILDTVKPTISITNDTIPTSTVLQANYSITFLATDAAPSSGLSTILPVVKLDDVVITPGVGGDYTIVVDASTANGVHTITADISDNAGNSAVQVVRTFTVNKNQITGQVELQEFVGTSREVAFSIDGGALIKKTLTFSNGVANYTLLDVPNTLTSITAKTASSLRQKLTITAGTNGQTIANFTGADRLLGGDLNNTNSVNVLDYSILKTKWTAADAPLPIPAANLIADINGNGIVNVDDYNIMKLNWFKSGD